MSGEPDIVDDFESLTGIARIREVMCRDDAFRHLVPSDLRQAVGGYDRAAARIAELEAEVERLREWKAARMEPTDAE